MAATFVVEDGTVVTGANAYVTEAEVTSYNDNHEQNTSWTGAGPGDVAQQKAIRLATHYLDLVYRHRWRSVRVQKSQPLAWPRDAVVDDYDGFVIDTDQVPQQVKDACAYLAIRSISGDSFLPEQLPFVESMSYSDGEKSETITYAGSGPSPGNTVRVYPQVELILADVIHDGPIVGVS